MAQHESARSPAKGRCAATDCKLSVVLDDNSDRLAALRSLRQGQQTEYQDWLNKEITNGEKPPVHTGSARRCLGQPARRLETDFERVDRKAEARRLAERQRSANTTGFVHKKDVDRRAQLANGNDPYPS